MKNKLNILYEDNHLIIVVKPINILSQSDNTKDIDMITIIKSYLAEKYNKLGNVYLGMVHRLDRPTEGIMIFAKTSKAAERLTNAFKKELIVKKYLAVIHGYLDNKEGLFEDYLFKDEKTNISKVTDKEHGKYSKLNYKVLKEKDNLSLVEITLHTGRSHQIRVQFSSRGYPLYGDQKYGKEDKVQLALCAYYIEFIHPVTKEVLNFEIKPTCNIWKLFDIK